MEEVQPLYESVVATEEIDDFPDIVRHKELVLPDTGLESIFRVGRKRTETGQWTTVDGILETPGTIQVLRLEVAREVSIYTIDERLLICFEQILPVRSSREIL